MPVPGVGVHRGNHPVGGDLADDPHDPVPALDEVLTDHARQQRDSLTDPLSQPATLALMTRFQLLSDEQWALIEDLLPVWTLIACLKLFR
ncbi:hypothetical protein GCM10010174_61060 [Kutzneria viridogrisea]